MAAQAIIFSSCRLFFFFLFSSPNLSRRRLDPSVQVPPRRAVVPYYQSTAFLFVKGYPILALTYVDMYSHHFVSGLSSQGLL